MQCQGAELMSKHGINVPKGVAVSSVEEVRKAISDVFPKENELVVKSQILAGGRGLGTFKSGHKGGVHIVKTNEAEDIAGKMLGQVLVTKQTGALGKTVSKSLGTKSFIGSSSSVAGAKSCELSPKLVAVRGISSCRTDVHLAHIRRCLSELKQYSAAREAGFAEWAKFSTQKAGWAQSAEQVVSVKAGNSEASMEHAAKASQAADSAEEQTTESKEAEETPQGQSSGSKTIFAANLSLPICKKDVVKFFEAVAEVTDVRFSSDMNGTFLGYCHVDFATAEAAKKAVKLNGKNFLGRPILIGFAREWGDVSPVQQSNQKPESLVRRFANSDTVVSMSLVTLTRDVGWLGVGALKWALEMYSGETEQAAETGENLVKEVKELKEMLAKVLENQGELLSRRRSWLPWR